jgi:hypothetical protein
VTVLLKSATSIRIDPTLQARAVQHMAPAQGTLVGRMLHGLGSRISRVERVLGPFWASNVIEAIAQSMSPDVDGFMEYKAQESDGFFVDKRGDANMQVVCEYQMWRRRRKNRVQLDACLRARVLTAGQERTVKEMRLTPSELMLSSSPGSRSSLRSIGSGRHRHSQRY